MKNNYYINTSGKLVRKNNTVTFYENHSDSDRNTLLYESDEYFTFGSHRDIPINDVDSFNIFSEVLMTKKFLEFLSSKGIPLNVFGYYGNFVGTFFTPYVKFSGTTLINQVKFVDNMAKRLGLAKQIVAAGITNIHRNIQYYKNRNRDFRRINFKYADTLKTIMKTTDINKLMLIEASFRKKYYRAFEQIITNGFKFVKRSTRPPKNEIGRASCRERE